MYESVGSKHFYPSLLEYWIQERDRIRIAKQEGAPRPWSLDPVFQTTYFCNVRREHDTVTKFIRQMYSEPDDEMFEYNIILSRFLNRPTTLISLGFIEHHSPSYVSDILKGIRGWGRTVWGNAYVVTTHGIRMDKIDYLCERVLPSLWDAYEPIRKACRHGVPPTCLAAYNALQAVEGIASFMAAQVVADLKNTPGHPLGVARDRREFVAPGPGSLRGVSWFQHSTAQHLSPSTFLADVREIREYVESQIYWFSAIDNQDLQNCLCEFDKYCRVRSGSGRSKRRYNGI